jgi:hypothetical protein
MLNSPLLDDIPGALTDIDRWVVMKLVERDGKATKPPFDSRTGAYADSTKPDTWSTFSQAASAYRQGGWCGVGLVVNDGIDDLVGVDLDHCVDDLRVVQPWAQEVIDLLHSYTEYSPTDGIRIWLRGALPPGRRKKGPIEAYSRDRYLTCTGRHVPGTPTTVETRVAELAQLHAQYFTTPTPEPSTNGHAASGGTEDDAELLCRMWAARNGPEIHRLWSGDWSAYPSQSEADLVLCGHLAFWAGRDASRIDRIFRGSSLFREKWDARRGATTYGAATIERAISQCRETYISGNGNGHPAERTTSTSIATDDPEPVSIDVLSVPSLPPSVIPIPWLRDHIAAVAAATETPPELPASMGLAVCSACVQRTHEVEPEPGYREPLNTWICVALNPGNRKSAVLNEMTAPVMDYERELTAELQEPIGLAESELRLAEERLSNLRRQAAKAKGQDYIRLKHEVRELEKELPEVPVPPRFWTQDVTPEKLASLMAEHDEKMAILSDEGGLFDTLAGRYSAGIPNLDLCLQAHAGSPHRVDRGSRPPVFLARPALTIAMSPQPDVLRGMAKQPGFRGRGFLARWLYVVPASKLGHRSLELNPVPAEVRRVYHEGIRSLLRLPQGAGGQPHVIRLSDAARQEWKAFQRHVEHEMRDGATFEHIRDWASKLPGAAARLAGVLHCCEHAADEPASHLVAQTTMDAALSIAAILEQHALATFSLMAADPTMDGARKIWGWIERQRRATFSRRDCFHALRGTFQRMEEFLPAVNILVERNYLFSLSPPTESRAGRPSPGFRVNTSLAKEWS